MMIDASPNQETLKRESRTGSLMQSNIQLYAFANSCDSSILRNRGNDVSKLGNTDFFPHLWGNGMIFLDYFYARPFWRT